MSRLRARGTRPHNKDSLLLRISAVWPVACMLSMATGCYFGPINLMDSNTTPVIYSSNVAFGEPIRIEKDETRVVVYASDEDGDDLFAVWNLSKDGFIHDAQTSYDPTFWSQVALDQEEDLEGQVLTVMISDGRNQASESWVLEVVR